MDKPKSGRIKLYYSSMDIVLYASLVFLAGICVGFAVGRYKKARFYFALKRLEALDDRIKVLQDTTKNVDIAMNNTVIPFQSVVRLRSPDYGCTNASVTFNNTVGQNFNYTRNYSQLPDILINNAGMSLNLADDTTTKWFAKTEFFGNLTGMNITTLDPPTFGMKACWITIPGITVP